MKNTIILLVSFLLLSCNDANNNTITETDIDQEKITITEKEITSIDYIEFVLDRKAEKKLSDWDKYIELNSIIENLKKGDMSYFDNNHETLKTFVDEFKKTLPETISSPSVLARMTVLETKMYKLESAVNLYNTSKKALANAIKELLVAYSNLNLQINKKFEKESQNIQKPQ